MFYQLKLRHYFTVVEEDDKNMRVHCKLCAPSSKTLSSAHNITCNLKKHLNTVHKMTTLVPITPGKTGKHKLDSIDEEQRIQAKNSVHYYQSVNLIDYDCKVWLLNICDWI